MKKDRREIDLLIDTMNQVNLKQDMKEEIQYNVQMYQRTHSRHTVKKFALIAAGIVLLMLVNIPVAAKVQSLIKERMEQLPQEQVDIVLEDLDAQQTEALIYSRDFTDNEYKLLPELEKQYRQGRFPKKELTQVSDVSQVDPERVCYLTTTGCYYFPEREMTEEELLEYIDFQNIIKYGLSERYEDLYADEIKEQEETDNNSINRIVNEGGISEEEATTIASTWMDKLYPGRKDGMEVNSYLYSSDENPMEDSQETIKYKNIYMVNFTVIHDYYYFYIDADTGNMASFIHTIGNEKELEGYSCSEEEIQKAIEKFLPDAKKQLEETLGIQTYNSCFALFSTSESGVSQSGTFSYHFITEAGDDFVMTYLAKTGEWVAYYDSLYPEYIELAEKAEQFSKEHRKNYEEQKHHKVDLS